MQEIAAIHVHIGPARTGVPSVSTQIAVLRSLLEEGKSAWGDVAKVRIIYISNNLSFLDISFSVGLIPIFVFTYL